MDIQGSNILDTVKVEMFEEPLFVDELSAQIISKSSEKEVKDEHSDESHSVSHEEIDIKTEEESEEDPFNSGKVNEREIKDEYFDVPESIAHEDIGIKTADQEDDQSNSNKVNEREIKDEYFDVPEPIAHEDIGVKNEGQEEGQSNSKHEEISTNKSERKYCCDKCSYKAKRKNYLVRHIRIHDKVNAPKYSCDQCPYQTIDKSNLKKHLRTHHCSGLICILCQKYFKQKIELDSHYISRHPDRSDRWGSMITNKINQCPKCNYKTAVTSSFKKHLATHGARTDQAQFKCNICEYKCLSKSNIVSHLRLHVGQLPFVCTECDKRFNTKHQLDGHIISRHSGNEDLLGTVTSKVHQCRNCDYKTVRNTDFKNHLKACL